MLDNAVTYTRAGEIFLSVRSDGADAIIRVTAAATPQPIRAGASARADSPPRAKVPEPTCSISTSRGKFCV